MLLDFILQRAYQAICNIFNGRGYQGGYTVKTELNETTGGACNSSTHENFIFGDFFWSVNSETSSRFSDILHRVPYNFA